MFCGNTEVILCA